MKRSTEMTSFPLCLVDMAASSTSSNNATIGCKCVLLLIHDDDSYSALLEPVSNVLSTRQGFLSSGRVYGINLRQSSTFFGFLTTTPSGTSWLARVTKLVSISSSRSPSFENGSGARSSPRYEQHNPRRTTC